MLVVCNVLLDDAFTASEPTFTEFGKTNDRVHNATFEQSIKNAGVAAQERGRGLASFQCVLDILKVMLFHAAQLGAVDKVSLCSALPTKKDAHRRHPACFIIRFRFNAVADKRQWSSAASKPRRKTRAKLCSRFCAENEPSHQTCRSFSASR